MAHRPTLLVLTAVVALAATACSRPGTIAPTPTAGPTTADVPVGLTPSPSPSLTPSAAPVDVIDFRGTHGVAIGAGRASLLQARLISATPSECGSPQLTAVPYASPIFVDDRLVLLWAYPPLHTPEGIAVGSPVDQVRRAYPGATDLTPPAGSQQYPGLLVTGAGDRAYLFLVDQGTVQKLIVGYASAAEELFRTGFGAC